MSAAEYIEYSITVKDEHNTLSKKEISYEPLLLSKNDETLAMAVEQLFRKFKENQVGEPYEVEAPEIILKFKMVWQA